MHDNFSSQQIKEGPAKQAWIKEQVKYEIERLKEVLRSRQATDEERAIAQSQIANYKEIAELSAKPSVTWLLQISFLADPCERHCSMAKDDCFEGDEDPMRLATSGPVTRRAWG